jgi:hypothetical protein
MKAAAPEAGAPRPLWISPIAPLLAQCFADIAAGRYNLFRDNRRQSVTIGEVNETPRSAKSARFDQPCSRCTQDATNRNDDTRPKAGAKPAHAVRIRNGHKQTVKKRFALSFFVDAAVS